MTRLGVWCVVLVLGTGVFFGWASTASAIPAFARRYGLACSACHVA